MILSVETDALTATVLVPSWRRPDSLARCLDALEGQERRPDEVLLIVRADDGETRTMVDARPPGLPIRLVPPDREGVTAALNVGFDEARGDIIAVVDDDTAPDPDWLARILARFAEAPDLAALGGRDRVVDGDSYLDSPEELPVGRVLWFGRVVGNHHLGKGQMRDVHIIKGANMSLRRSALRDIRIDPTLRGQGMQLHWEIDLCLALGASGGRLAYDPAIQLDHFAVPRQVGGREGFMSPQEDFDAIHNQTVALLKHLPPGRRLVAYSYALLVGTRADPGPVLALAPLVQLRSPRSALRRSRVATAARIEALRSLRRWRRQR